MSWGGLHKGLHRLGFYVRNFSYYFMPRCFRRWQVSRLLSSLSETERLQVEQRVQHYVRFEKGFSLPCITRICGEEQTSVVQLREFRYPWGKKKKQKHSAYFLDLYRAVGMFPENYRFAYIFGDIRKDYDMPFFVKSRPIREQSNAVIMRLNSLRHFQWVNDKTPFRKKANRIVSRNEVRKQPWRALLLEKYVSHPMCDFGMINNDVHQDHPEWHKSFLTKEQQMQFKFIMCIEGNDVASNMKWVMSSNSIAVMPKPKVESWFMESTLKADYHYIEIKDDYSDLIEKVQFYIDHTAEAEAIITHAHDYVRQFWNGRVEHATEVKVAERYFQLTNQE